jgi:hypothetical protein
LLLGFRPEFGDVGQLLAVDDDQQVIIGEIAPDRILDPIAARVAAEQYDLEQLAAAKLWHGAPGDREGEPLAHAIDHERQLMPLLGEMVKIALHGAGETLFGTRKGQAKTTVGREPQARPATRTVV